MNKLLEEDFQYIINAPIPWDRLNNKTIFITGGTGFLGSLLTRFFSYLNLQHQRNIAVVLLVRDEEKAKRIIGDCSNVKLVKGDVCDLSAISAIQMDIDIIFHCAAATASSIMVEKPVEVAEGIVLGTSNIMKLAHEKKVENIVYLSSMEIYGKVDCASGRVSEEKSGFVEIMSPRSCYPLGKRMAENICFDYHSEYGVPVKIARLAQTFGPGVPQADNRVFAQFAWSVIHGEDIVLHTKGEADTNCCYTADAITALFVLLFHGENGEAYNITNEANHMTVREMAELVADKVAQGSISVRVEMDDNNVYGYPPPAKLNLSSQKIRMLGWNPKFGMEQMYTRMIEYMRG